MDSIINDLISSYDGDLDARGHWYLTDGDGIITVTAYTPTYSDACDGVREAVEWLGADADWTGWRLVCVGEGEGR